MQMYNDPSAWVQPDQGEAEFTQLLNLYRQLRPKRVLEIGIREGGTFNQWICNAMPDATIIGIDLPPGNWGENITAQFYRLWKAADRYSVTVQAILGNSHHPLTKSMIKAAMPEIDFLFIDGDHTLAGVTDDFEFYGDLVVPGGVIVLHDILANKLDPNIQVCRLWERLKASGCNWAELVECPDQPTHGIGVLYK